MFVKTVGGARYFVLFKDDHSTYRVVFVIKQKSDVLSCLNKYAPQLEREIGKKMRVLQSDRGGEFTGTKVIQFLDDNSIAQELTCPYIP